MRSSAPPATALGRAADRQDASARRRTAAPGAPLTPLAYTNPKIQRLRRLLARRAARQEEGAFVIEGAALLAEAASVDANA